MMPGAHIPPTVPHHHQGRRQGDHQYHYQLPPQTHSPVHHHHHHHHHNPYAAQYHPQHHYGAPHVTPFPQQVAQWYQPNPYHQPHQYAMPPRPFQPHGSPIVVSSHPHAMVPMPPVNRSLGQTPPIAHSRTPPVMRTQTPQPAPSTPSVTSHTHVSSPTPPTDMTTPTPPPITPSGPSFSAAPPSPTETHRMPYYPKLPWLSVPDEPFPPRSARRRRKRRTPVSADGDSTAFPSRDDAAVKTETEAEVDAQQSPTARARESDSSTIAATPDVDTPTTSQAPSEVELEYAQTLSASSPKSTQPTKAPISSHTRTATIPAIPLVPIKSAKAPSVGSTTQKSAKSVVVDKEGLKKTEEVAATPAAESNISDETPKASPPPKQPVSSWAALLRSKASAAAGQTPVPPHGVIAANGAPASKGNTLSDVLASFSVKNDKKISFLEPRGLVNSGNLCYMNSILQVLIFCVPFFDLLDKVAQRAVHSFKSETPLIDAMIMFMRDFKVIDSAESAEKLRMRLKDNELEQYGDPLSPEYVYDVIKRLPRFDNMKRGSQEDAEEFLGFLLAGLHDECAHVIKSGRRPSVSAEALTSPKSERSGSVDSGWQEVGPKQKSAVTQSSGAIEIETPLTKIFGGKLRSEYRKPGEKPSITLEPYQPLQLDISSPAINNISDALKAMTHLETLDGSTRGARASTKQVFIESLPPVLILHLKRFHYDANGPQKIWKKIGYPLDLEIPKDVFPQHMRGSFGVRGGLPRYRLTAVVYHHGKNASGGHYTVDLRRQEGREWVRMDDTIIRRIRPEDVAEGGAEEDPKALAAALEQHKQDASKGRNFYELGGEEQERKDGGGWSKVNGVDKKGSEKKWSAIANGTATPPSAGKRTPLPKENVRDNKVAYILFYQRVEA